MFYVLKTAQQRARILGWAEILHKIDTTIYPTDTSLHTITPVFPEGLGIGVPMYTHSSPVCFRSHEVGGEPIAINRILHIGVLVCYEF